MPSEKDKDDERDDRKDTHEHDIPRDPAIDDGFARIEGIDVADCNLAVNEVIYDRLLPSVSGCRCRCRETVSARPIRAAGDLILVCDADLVKP